MMSSQTALSRSILFDPIALDHQLRGLTISFIWDGSHGVSPVPPAGTSGDLYLRAVTAALLVLLVLAADSVDVLALCRKPMP